MYSQQVSTLYLHSLMLQQRISQLDTEIRKTARLIAENIDTYNVVGETYGFDCWDALDLETWIYELICKFEDLESDYNYYTRMFDALLIEDPSLIAA